MSPSPSSDIPPAQDTTFADANQAAEQASNTNTLSDEARGQLMEWARKLRHRQARYNTPFDARKEKKRKFKRKLSRKESKRQRLARRSR